MTTMIDIQNMARAAAANTGFADGDPFALENFDPFFKDFVRTFEQFYLRTAAHSQKLRLEEFYKPIEGPATYRRALAGELPKIPKGDPINDN